MPIQSEDFLNHNSDVTLRWTGGPIKRACRQCKQSKRRCTLEKPVCGRCGKLALDCSYHARDGSGLMDKVNGEGHYYFGDGDGDPEHVPPQIRVGEHHAEAKRGIRSPYVYEERMTGRTLYDKPDGDAHAHAKVNLHADGCAESVGVNQHVGGDGKVGAQPCPCATIPPSRDLDLFSHATNQRPTSHPQHQLSGTRPITTSNQRWEAQPKPRHTIEDGALTLEFEGNLDLVSGSDAGIDAGQVGMRWMEHYIPGLPGQREKTLSTFTVSFLERILSRYWRLDFGLCRAELGSTAESLPPFIHPCQIGKDVVARPLIKCEQLTRQFEACLDGNGDEAVVMEEVKREMDTLLKEYRTYPSFELLAAYQAFLVYILMAYFSHRTNTSPSQTPLVTHNSLIQLQEIASYTSGTGVICRDELQHMRPKWESWIVAAAKRRTIYATYLFNNIFNAHHSSSIYLAEELAGLPVPTSKRLWEVKTRDEWEKEYDRHLKGWPDGELQIQELWAQEDLQVDVKEERKRRVERWVGEVDEFGMMVFATCAHIHGC
ncbi:hypothetical protein K469DRAFT_654446 [Zopfia rhizophila CBS 207.26]|uniref:Zn(2)-C6 fungal-type domain-containing protein n=1 Tax=Zopfia rhizophila CBS 207.26 TaxID=1314779 RepID=A0A6A6ENX6_9PEZI|nr:hypothetical protein K469DRAFT_654446 [Zopfia rhizophila CBS 207.26]